MKSAFLLPIFALLPAIASADTPATYTLMAPLTGALTGSPDLSHYLQGVVQLTIGIAGVLAVIMIVYCGIQLMGTPSASGKSAAKECVWNAIFGVLLAIGAWVLLNTINPLLLSNELNLGNVTVTGVTVTPEGPVTDPYPTKSGWYFKYSDAKGIHYNPAGNSAETCAALIDPAKAAGKIIVPLDDGRTCFEVTATAMSAGESSARTALCGNTSCVGSTPIGVNNKPCPNVGATGCTNVDGLPSIGFIKSTLQPACGCNVVVTGGTEYWLHKTHAAGQPIFDLRKDTAINNFLLTSGTGKRSSFTNYYRIYWSGYWFTDEGDHWHACALNTSSYWFCTNVITKGGATVAP